MSAEGTKRTRAEKGVSENEARLQEIFSQVAVGIAQIGLDGEWLLVNNRYCEMLGYSEAELREKTLQELTHPDELSRVQEGRRQLLAGEISSHVIEKRFIRKDGTIFWGRLHRSLARDRENQPKYLIAVVEDLTEKIQVDRALRDAEQRLALAQEAAHLGVWDRDLRTDVITICGNYAQLHGLPPDRTTLTLEECMRSVHPDDRERVQALRREARELKHAFDAEYRVIWPEGTIHWLRSKGTVLVDDSGCAIRTMGVVEDVTQRKHDETALRESEERLRFAQRAAGIATFDWNIENGVNAWTPELEAMYGLPPGGFPGTQAAWEDLVHPDDRARAVQLVTKSFEAGTPTRGEWRVVWPDGSVHWLSGRWQVFKNSVGKPVRMTGVNIDITDRQHVKEALLQSEERFRLAIQATNDAVWDIDLATGTVRWNETYATLYGRPPETSNSWQWWIDCIHPEDRERTSDGLRSAISGSGSTWTCEYRFQRVDGAWAHLYDRAYIARDASGIAWRVIGAMQDLTERKRAEAELRESEERFRNIADSAPVIVWVCGPDGAVTFTNRFGLNFVGRTMEQALGMGWINLLHPDDSERAASEFSSAIADHRTYQISFRIRRADGEYRWMLTNGAPRFAGDVYTGHIGITSDITELKQSQEQLQAAQKLESLGAMAGGIAHDFNNLLGGILAEAELVESDLAADSAASEEIQRIKIAAIRGSEIVRELMIYAGTDQRDVNETVDVSRLVNEMLELLKVSIPKQVVLKTDFHENLPAVRANASQIRQVVMNLVLNASEAIGAVNGVITVATVQVSGGSALVSNNAKDSTSDDYVRLEVSDTGSGMTEEIKSKIFDPFYSTKFPGRGLGLAVVQGIVRDLGGSINVVSAPGQGTAFQILLPCDPKGAVDIHSAIKLRGPDKLNARAGTILVVEDEEMLRRSVSTALLKRGYSVIEAGDGSVAMDQIHSHIGDIDLVLLDVTLPGVSSRDVFEEARRLRPDLRVILTSAYGEEMVRAYYSGLRVDHFIRKPFHLGDLVRLFGTALAAKAGAARTP